MAYARQYTGGRYNGQGSQRSAPQRPRVLSPVRQITPTAEQQAIIDAYRTGADLVINAGAGSGKTSTLRLLANATPGKQILYLAYNGDTKRAAYDTFPRQVTCKTTHGLAWTPIGPAFTGRTKAARMKSTEIARLLKLHGPTKFSERTLAPAQIASIVMQTIKKFTHTADLAISDRHVPRDVKGLESRDDLDQLRAVVTPIARRAWAGDITSEHGKLPFDHDCYLKMFALQRPRLGYDVILLDEAQDTNPCVEAMIEDQRQYGTQLILVGDQYQSLYGWRGATNAMVNFNGQRFILSQSFRFGPKIAEQANIWLGILGADLRLTGFDKIPSRVEALTQPSAILCRTNAEALSQAIRELGDGRRVCMAGGTKDLKSMAYGAIDLKEGRPADHRDLCAFSTWGEVQDYVEDDPAGADLKVFVKLIDSYDPWVILDILNQLTDKADHADVVICTVHKSKGLEYRTVLLASDFAEPREGEPISEEMAMVIYVAVTRAKLVLDPAGVAWVKNHL